jgi:hypothetical protein
MRSLGACATLQAGTTPETVVDRSKLLLVAIAALAIAALVVLALITLIVSQEPGYIDPDNPPPATQPTAP